MPNFFAILHIARLEAKLLFRSWAFRIFSLIGLVFIVILDIALGSTVGGAPHAFWALSGAMPMMNVKLLNVYQGIIIVFLATEFIKRDRQYDTTQVLFTRSFSNIDYYAGKVLGILMVFMALNIITFLPAVTIHLFFSNSPFAVAAYFWYVTLISLPTLTLMLGLSLLLITALRSQALVFIIMLALSLISLIMVGHKYFYILDVYAFHQPIMFSDFTSLSNLKDLLTVRGLYFLIGISAVAGATLMMDRLRQSKFLNILAAIVMVAGIGGSVYLASEYVATKNSDLVFREKLRQVSQLAAKLPSATMTDCDLELKPIGSQLLGKAKLTLVNRTGRRLDSLLLTLNPGLELTAITGESGTIDYRRNLHLIWLKPAKALSNGQVLTVTIDYAGEIDNRFCYLDIDDDRFFGPARAFMYSFPKKYAILTEQSIHLTAEAGFYPRSGLYPGRAYPLGGRQDFAHYTIKAELPSKLVAISQGEPTKTSDGASTKWSFAPTSPLPQISFTAAEYLVNSIVVDSTTYSIYVLTGHDYYHEYLDELNDTLPKLIRELRDEYELSIGLTYPHDRLSLIEVPIDCYSYNRKWTRAHETVQPEIICISEMGTYNSGTDFRRFKKNAIRRQERANQADRPVDIQTSHFQTFVRSTLLGNERNFRAERQTEEIETSCLIFPQFVTYQTFIQSDRWPVMNYAFEAQLNSKVSVPQSTRGRAWRGLTNTERANQALQQMSLEDLLNHPEIEKAVKMASLSIKGSYLMALFESQVNPDDQENWLQQFVKNHKASSVADSTLLNYLASLGSEKPEEMIEEWYRGTVLSGYLVKDIESYKVLDGDRVKTQVKFTLSNPTDTDGLVEVGFTYRAKETNFGRWWNRSQSQYDLSQKISLPAKTGLEIGFVLDQPLQTMTIDTYVSKNLPSVFRVPFRDQKLRANEIAWEGEKMIEADSTMAEQGEHMVDNEDPGFVILKQPKENWLRRSLMHWLDVEDDDQKYAGLRSWDPPGQWLATTHQDFYGTFVHSAYFKETGSGASNVAWVVDLEETANYEIYYFCSRAGVYRHWGRRRSNTSTDYGKRNFQVFHENGTDEVPIDLNGVEEGWNLLGTYRLAAGENRVEMTDLNNPGTQIVTADAIKWVKRNH